MTLSFEIVKRIGARSTTFIVMENGTFIGLYPNIILKIGARDSPPK